MKRANGPRFGPRRKPPAKLRILITAGPTREYIDPVRYLSNDSSGQMGFAIAAEAAARGHRVTLIAGPVALETPPGVSRVDVVSAAEMLAACRKHWPGNDLLIMAAAVADYTPANVSTHKRKKNQQSLVLPLRPTVDILAALSNQRRPTQTVVGFALEDRNERRNAEDKVRRKRLSAIVLNRPAAIGARASEIEVFVADEGWIATHRAAKSRHARLLVPLFETLAARRLNLPASGRR